MTSSLSLGAMSAALSGLLCLAAWLGADPSLPPAADDRGTVVLERPRTTAVRPSVRSADGNDSPPHGVAHAAQPAERLQPERPTGCYGPAVPDEGATASLSGVLRHVDRPGERFVLRFDRGPDAGVEIRCDAQGHFAADGLHPGLAIVSLIGSEGSRCRRELLLRHRRAVELSVDFGDFGAVSGRVLDEQGAPVPEAVVSLDGHETTTDADGTYRIARCASGEALLMVIAPGFASYCERLPAPGTRPHAGGRLRLPTPGGTPSAIAADVVEDSRETRAHVVLQAACTLELRVPSVPGASGEAVVQLIPSGAQRLSGLPPRAAFPWHRHAGLRVPLGGTIVIDDLPATRIDVFVFHGLARSRPTHAWTSERQTVVTVEMEALPTLSGRVLDGGEPVAGARVRLRFANPVAATQGALGPSGGAYTSQPLAFPPQLAQHVVTDEQGRFRVAVEDRVRLDNERFLTVTAPSGDLTITREVPTAARALDIDLAAPGRARP